MEDESTEGHTLSLEVPAALDEWLTERAAELDIDRSELIRLVLGGYQMAAETADDESVVTLETALEQGTVDVDGTIQAAVDEAVDEAVSEGTAIADPTVRRLESRLDGRIDRVEAAHEEQLDEIRRRVVQVKDATEAKADADHTHPEFEQTDRLAAEVETLDERVSALEQTVDEEVPLEAELADVREKLTQLARVVLELRGESESEGPEEPDEADGRLDGIKRTAAREGYGEAVCDDCGEPVRVAPLPEAECPHCGAQFENIAAGSDGLFGSTPRLVVSRDEGGAGQRWSSEPDDTLSESPPEADEAMEPPSTVDERDEEKHPRRTDERFAADESTSGGRDQDQNRDDAVSADGGDDG
ncbi:MAG: hypothetical protein ABEJ05_12100 [Haloglomus sp.]